MNVDRMKVYGINTDGMSLNPNKSATLFVPMISPSINTKGRIKIKLSFYRIFNSRILV